MKLHVANKWKQDKDQKEEKWWWTGGSDTSVERTMNGYVRVSCCCFIRMEIFVESLFYLLLWFCSEALKVEQCRGAEGVQSETDLTNKVLKVLQLNTALTHFLFFFFILCLDFCLFFRNKSAIIPGLVWARLIDHTTGFGNTLRFFSIYSDLNGSIGDRRQWWQEQTWFMGAVSFTVSPKIFMHIPHLYIYYV